MSQMLDPRLYFRVPSINKDDAIKLMCDRMASEGMVDDSFLQDVLERERLSPTAFGGSIAIPHSMSMNARCTAISILISGEPITWGESRVQLVALFALAPNGRHVFRDVLDKFIATLSDPARITALVTHSANYDSFMRALMNCLDS
jgi:lichenan operon transcriptional antiterminator